MNVVLTSTQLNGKKNGENFCWDLDVTGERRPSNYVKFVTLLCVGLKKKKQTTKLSMSLPIKFTQDPRIEMFD